MKRTFNIIIFSFLTILLADYQYSLEDYNSTSPTYGLNVWYPEYSGYITLHYFGTQGWGGWTSIFGQLSNFQDEIRSDGYENVVIIGVGQTNISNFNNNFTANSDLPLVMDLYPMLPIRAAFDGLHKEVVVLDANAVEIGRVTFSFNSISEHEDYLYDLIVQNYPEESVLGDVNGDQTVNIQDIILIINMILVGSNDAAGDINSDGTINILDVVQMVNIILG